VKIAYDPTEGIIRLEVRAAEAESAARFSRALIRYAEAQVDQLTQRVREDQMKGARDSMAEAEAKMAAAQQALVTLQQELKVLSSAAEVGADHRADRHARGAAFRRAAFADPDAAKPRAQSGPDGPGAAAH
jgi:capsule polysaccharide export protein KpsE/RkpR